MEDMAGIANPADDPGDAAALAAHASVLADAMIDALPGWVARTITERLMAARGSVTDEERTQAEAAGRAMADEVAGPLRQLLSLDIHAQSTTPLEVVRTHLGGPTEVLHGLGVPPVARDAFEASQFPGDVYDFGPRAYTDLDPGLQEPALTWGAAKAHVHLQRRRHEGRL